MHQKILAVDDEPDILRLTQFLLESWGYDVVTAANGKKAIETAQAETPDLILMDVNMEEMNGFEACAKLKSDFATSFIPVIMLTSQDQVQNKITGLGQGADDYVIKTVDPLELQLTRLPGNIALEREIKNRLQGGAHFSVCYCDLDNFKAYNDKYGYEAGDKVIVHAAQLLMDVVRELSDGGDFVEHIGGDDFVILTSPERDSDICRRVVDGFDQTIPDFYGEEDRARKGIQVENRSGHLENFPLMTITVAVVSGSREDLKSTHVIAERAAELKKYLKRFAGSNYLSERRGVREPSKDRQTEKVATSQGLSSAG